LAAHELIGAIHEATPNLRMKHALFEESLHSPLIIHTPSMQELGKQSAAIVDIFPTLCDLAGLSRPDFTDGRSLLPQIKDPPNFTTITPRTPKPKILKPLSPRSPTNSAHNSKHA